MMLQPNPPAFLLGYIVTIDCLVARYGSAIEAAERANGAITNLHGWEAIARKAVGDCSGAKGAAERFFQASRKTWCGHGPMTPTALCDWFAASFPIKNGEDADRYDRTLRELVALAA